MLPIQIQAREEKFVLVQVLRRITFPASEVFKIKNPKPLSSLHVCYWSLWETRVLAWEASY